MSNINTIKLAAGESYEIEALHFKQSETLDTPKQ